ncbi:ABC transporter permease [Micromonospora sp. NPDC049559]|uniref:ABC transporter permease n=1 Tax=Micromonospora sp. NPDC049559 TaxID=3155923 RepID=UPI00343DF464
MNLVLAELLRLGGRRFVQLMLVLLVVAFGVTIATTMSGSHRPSGDELQRAEQQVLASWQRDRSAYEGCVDAKIRGNNGEAPVDGSESGAYPKDCESIRPLRRSVADFLPGIFVFDKEVRPLVYFLIGFLVLFGFLVAASYVGADLTSGGMTNLLLWRPRRLLVLGTKLGTLLGGLLVLSVLATVVYLAAFWAVAESNGLPGRVGADFWRWLSLSVGRGLVLVVLAAVTGFAIATLGRHTAAALGVVAAYAVVWEAGARIVMEIVGVHRLDQFMLSTHVSAWMQGELRLWDTTECLTAFSNSCDPTYTLTWRPALVVLLGVAGALAAAAFATFQRRDLA